MSSFNERCYAILMKVPRGKVTTYKALANALGTKAYRAVGNAMNKNPYAPKVPCHRVIGSNGALVGFASGLEKKRKILEREGIKVDNGRVDLERYEFEF
jgi:methylated-DNA-[protein]-cysteine S-methyltransferase